MKTASRLQSVIPPQLILIGLGNHGFPLTRHSVGQLLLQHLAILAASLPSSRGTPHLQQTSVRTILSTHIRVPAQSLDRPDGLDVLFLKPTSPMNLSGPAVIPAIPRSFPRHRIIALCDELDLPPSTLRTRFGGSAKGHNGIRSLEAALGSKDFWRMKVGIGRPEQKGDVVQWVMGGMARNQVRACEVEEDGSNGGATLKAAWAEVIRIAELDGPPSFKPTG